MYVYSSEKLSYAYFSWVFKSYFLKLRKQNKFKNQEYYYLLHPFEIKTHSFASILAYTN